MARPGYLVLTSDRSDEADWLTEMLDNGWKLVSVHQGKFYFESLDVITARTAEAIKRDFKANGPMREAIQTAADDGVDRARRELRL